ncbi:uncharacterized protein C7orf57 [Patella vulgata]|uniref:uncharacterized protein C7orf57 n=1 Tax=Patella vulgata TaxID=6465 RepID=UPI0024A86056|nr:uncharacterized protein C7orf57 [Patella vulgata]
MATNKNINECGWFYHAPAKRNTKSTEPVDTPYISQIPGLSEIPQEEFTTDPHKLYFKETDTKFVRMAKQGGRKDLLVFREPSGPSKEAKGYPRVDWFYLQDNAMEDAENEGEKKPWEFLLPEYMVHDSYTPSFADGAPVGSYGPGETGRVPYACDKVSVFQSEGRDATDKRVRLPEARPPGYGVRNSKPVKARSQAGKPTATVSHQDHTNTSVTKGDRYGQMNQIISIFYIPA